MADAQEFKTPTQAAKEDNYGQWQRARAGEKIPVEPVTPSEGEDSETKPTSLKTAVPQPAPAGGEASPGVDATQGKPKKPRQDKGAESRIQALDADLKREREQWARDREQYERQLLEARRPQSPQQPEVKPPAATEKPLDAAWIEERAREHLGKEGVSYERALAQANLDYLNERDNRAAATSRQAEFTKTLEAKIDGVQKRIDEARSRIPDFDQVVTNKVNLGFNQQGALDFASFYSNSPDMIYYLAQHPDEQQSIRELSGESKIHALNDLSYKLRSPQSGDLNPGTPEPRQPHVMPTRVGPPPKHVPGRGSAGPGVQKSPDEEAREAAEQGDMAAWKAARARKRTA